MENTMINEMEVNENMAVVEETKEKGFFAKVGGFAKKHAKKFAIGAALLVAGGLVGHQLGKKSDSEESYDTDEVEVDNDIVTDDVEVTVD